MKTLQIQPIHGPINARVRVPGSKSVTNRALLIAALADGKTLLRNALFSDDSRIFAQALAELGFEVQLNERGKTILVTGLGGTIPAHQAQLFVGNSGTTARFLSAFLSLGKGKYFIDGEDRMRERPIGDLIDSLAGLGVDIRGTLNKTNGLVCPPVEINSNGVAGGSSQVSGRVSSQYLSALMMVAPYMREGLKVSVIDALNSKPYVEMTEKVMADFGVHIDRWGDNKYIIPNDKYHPREFYDVESDASAASYFFALPAITGGRMVLENISKNSIQGDIQFLDVLQKMGLLVREVDGSIEVVFDPEKTALVGVEVNMSNIPDTAQTLAVIAPFASTPTTITGIASARIKETDRINATCCELKSLGVQVEEYPDGMKIYPCDHLNPATIKTYKDHRMAMAFALVGSRIDGIVIEDPDCVSKTFPDFFEVLNGVAE